MVTPEQNARGTCRHRPGHRRPPGRYGVPGHCGQPGPGFPAHYAAPYAEMWNSPSTLMAAANATGNKYYTLAFIISDGTCNATHQR